MRPFNLDEYLKNPTKKVITGSGKSVRIICTNKLDSTTPIVALIYKGAEEVIQLYTKEGRIISKYPCFEHDLFFAPVKKEGWINLFKVNSTMTTGEIYNTEEEAKSAIKNTAVINSSIYISTVKIEWEE